MSMYFIGIDISKYKHDCCIISAAVQKAVSKVTIKNNKTSSVDCESIARLHDKLIRQRSFYLVKITNVFNHTFPEFKPFFNERLSKTALYLFENYDSAEKMAKINSASYEKLRSLSRGKFSPHQFLQLKELVANTVGVNSSIFAVELNSLLALYKSLAKEIEILEKEIKKLIEEVHPHYISVPGIDPLSATVIYSEYGDISNFSNSGQMLAFAGIEPDINEPRTESHGGRRVKRESPQLRYTLINCCHPLIRFDMTFATYYAKKRTEGKPHQVP